MKVEIVIGQLLENLPLCHSRESGNPVLIDNVGENFWIIRSSRIMTNYRHFITISLFSLALFFGINTHTGYAQEDPFESQLPKPQVQSPEIIPEAPAPLPVEEVINPPAISISSLIAGGPAPQAIINGKILRVGSEIEGAVIKAITKEGIEVTLKGKSFSYPAPSKNLKYTQGGKDEQKPVGQ